MKRLLFTIISIIIWVFVFFNAMLLSAQMTKLIPQNQTNINYFGTHVAISSNKILVLESDYNREFDKRQYYVKIYDKEKSNILLNQILPENYQQISFEGKEDIYYSWHFPKLRQDLLIHINKLVNKNEDGVLNLYHLSDGIFTKMDSIVFRNNFDNWSYDVITEYDLTGKSLFFRKVEVRLNPWNTSTFKSFDHYYKIENNHLVFIDSVFYRDYEINGDYSGGSGNSDLMTDDFIYISDISDNTNGQNNGSVLIYTLKNNKLEYFQKLFQPDPANGNSYFGTNLAVSPDSKYLAVSTLRYQNTYKKCVYIYKLNGNQYELMQTIYPDLKARNFYVELSLDNLQLFIGDADDRIGPLVPGYKGSIFYYTLKDNEWKLNSVITPPKSDDYCGSFGYSIAHEGETVVAGAENDTTYGVRYYYPDNGGTPFVSPNGAAYVFQVPARDTLDISICEGESYWFGEEALTMSAVYRDTLLASYGVDSVVVLNLSVLPPLKSEVDTVLCPGQELKVGDQVLSSEGHFTIPLKNIYGCDSIVSMSLSYAYLDMEAEVSPDFGCQNGKISLLMQGNNPPYGYQWSNGAITADSLTDLSPGIYAVTVTDRSGCSFALQEIEVKEEKAFELPNAFIPSSQMEENQRFRPYLFPGYEEMVTITEMDVFNRFGEKVYSGTDPMGWDGTFRGEPSPPGSYLFRIILNTPCGEEMRTGSLLLVR